MGESTHEWTKKQKTSRHYTCLNAVCEDCGKQWTATVTEVPVTTFIKDLDEYYKNLENSLIETVDPPMVLCVFRPSDKDIHDTEVTLSCIAPLQESPYNWHITHKYSGPAAPSGCQIIPKRYNSGTNEMESSSSQQEMVTIKEEIKEEEDEIMEDILPDPLAVDKDIKPDVNSISVPSESENSNSCQDIDTSTPQQNPAVKRSCEELDDAVPAHVISSFSPSSGGYQPTPGRCAEIGHRRRRPKRRQEARVQTARVHQLVNKPATQNKMYPQVRCRQCTREGRGRKCTTTICNKCPEQPGLCSIACFDAWHAPIFQQEPEEARAAQEARVAKEAREQQAVREQAARDQRARLHQLVNKPATQNKMYPQVRCRQCTREGRGRKCTTTICNKCPEQPGLCSIVCFDAWHAPMFQQEPETPPWQPGVVVPQP